MVRCASGSLRWLLGIVLAGLLAEPCYAQVANVSTPAQFKQALRDPSVSSISVLAPIALDNTWGPVVVTRQVLVASPHRAIIDFCDDACNTGNVTHPQIIIGSGGSMAFTRLFFRNFIPTNPNGTYTGWDFSSPAPAIVSRGGGQSTYNLVVWHWNRNMTWAFNQTGSFWAEAARAKLRSVGDRQLLQFNEPKVYNLKNFAVNPSALIVDSYIPMDLNGCFWDEPLTTLVYCPYTFKDALRNPYARNVVVFHDIGLDPLVNSYRVPVMVNRAVTFTSCPGRQRVIDMDNVTYSVLVGTDGLVTLQHLKLQGSKSNSKPDWPSNIPLLISTFKLVDNGRVVVRNSTFRVRSTQQLANGLEQLPSGALVTLEVPDLQPRYAGPPCSSTEPNTSCVIDYWRLSQQGWLLFKSGAKNTLQNIGTTSWEFSGVQVEQYRPTFCFEGAVLMGALSTPDAPEVARVSTGQQLLDNLANSSVRYIQVVNDLTIPANATPGQVVVNRIVEVRACHPTGGTYTVNWGNLERVVSVGGNLIFEGDLLFEGLGWVHMGSDLNRPVAALEPGGAGIVEFADLTMLCKLTRSQYGNDRGLSLMKRMLRYNLNTDAANISALDYTDGLQFRTFVVNSTDVTGGVAGTTSFVDCNVIWFLVADSSSSPPVAVIVPVVLGVLLLVALGVAAVLYNRQRTAGAAGKGTGKPLLIPGLGSCKRSDVSSGTDSPSSNIGDVRAPDDLATYSRLSERSLSSGSVPASSSRRTGPSQDIQEACRNLTQARIGTDTEPVVLQSVLGEGSYGKVYKGCWRGSIVAVKVMVLPSYMAGKERRERMAIMETAISSSLSHPNIVQTYTYAVEPVKGNSSVGASAASGDVSFSVHDSSRSFPVALSAEGGIKDGSGSSPACLHSWEVRLVQEFCDQGSLKDALSRGEPFRTPEGVVDMALVVDTALDVARAMVHLHAQNIVHSDLKARNVLLKGSSADHRGFTAKVADFGLSLHLDINDTHISNAFQGTMTHMAPETLLRGHVSRASDVYAFGILLWELVTGQSAYRGIPRALLGHQITAAALRPVFPRDTLFEFQLLACRCWETDATIRPTFEQILEELKRIRRKVSPDDVGMPPEPVLPQAATSAAMTPADLLPPPWELHRSKQPLPSILDMDETLLTSSTQQPSVTAPSSSSMLPLMPMIWPLHNSQPAVTPQQQQLAAGADPGVQQAGTPPGTQQAVHGSWAQPAATLPLATNSAAAAGGEGGLVIGSVETTAEGHEGLLLEQTLTTCDSSSGIVATAGGTGPAVRALSSTCNTQNSPTNKGPAGGSA